MSTVSKAAPQRMVKVYFAHTAQIKEIPWCIYLHNLAFMHGYYMASLECDYHALTSDVCANCHKPESDHALHGDWCPANHEDVLFSTTHKWEPKP